MSLVHIPFTRGEDQSVDPKVAPVGVLRNAENVRFERDGRIAKRPGFSSYPLTVESAGAGVAGALSNLVALMTRDSDRLCFTRTAPYVFERRFGAWQKVQNGGYSPGLDFAAGERFPVARNRSGQTLRSSVGYTNGFVCVAYEVGGSIFFNLYTESDMTLVLSQEVSGGSTTCKRPKVIAVDTLLLVLFLDTSTFKVRQFRIDTTLSSPPTTVAAIDVAPFHSSNDYFDAAPYSTTEYLLVGQSSATQFTVYRVQFGPSLTASYSFAATGPMAVCGAAGERVSVAWRVVSTGAINLLTCDTGLTTSVGPTTLDTNTDYQGAPVVARESAAAVLVACSGTNTAVQFDQYTFFATRNNLTNAGVAGPLTVGRYRLASKPAYFNGVPYVWKVNTSTYDRYYVLAQAYASPVSTFLARSLAADFSAVDHLGEFVTYTTSAGRTFGLWAFPWISSGSVKSTTPFCSIDVVKIEFGGTEQFQNTVIGKTLYHTRGLLSMFDGQLCYESGFVDSPEILSAVGQVTGALTPSKTYQYVMTREWYDFAGQKHVSQVSDPVSVLLTAGQAGIVLRFRKPGGSKRDTGASEFFVRDHLWRTQADGSVFQRITPDSGVPGTVNSFGSTIYTDTAADTAIVTNPVLYTQGVRGGLSGPLQHDPPAPCRYIWGGKERVIIGGLENSDEVRWSKYFFPGEPLEFSEQANYRKRIPGRVTAVALIDDGSVVFTRDRIFLIFGDGPDDSGNGTFQEPRALPSDVGCIDWRSLVECSLGLFFQGRSDRLYLLPRGFSSPVWVGQPVRGVLEQFPVVTSARLMPDDNLVVFTVTDTAGANGRLLCFDVRTNQWTVDKIAGGAAHIGSAIWNSNLVLATTGVIDLESRTLGTDRGAFFGVTVETAALRPGGLQQDMRTRKVAVLGEYQGSSVLKLELSTDDSQAYAYSRQWNLDQPAVPAPGDSVRREWDLPAQKFGACSIKISELDSGAGGTRGFVLNGLTLETRARPGMPRVRESFR